MSVPTTDYQFDPGNDLADFGVLATELLAAIKLALPNSYHGGVIVSTTAPAVTGQPSGYPTDWYAWHKRCLWLNAVTGLLSVYKTSVGWISIFDAIPANTITTAMLQNLSVTIGKMSATGGAAYQIMRVNAGATALEFVSPNDAITAVAINKLVGGGAGLKFVQSADNVVSWANLDSALILTLFEDNEIPVTYLAHGTTMQVLATNDAGNNVEWRNVLGLIANGSFNILKIDPGSGNALKVLRVNATGAAVEFATLTIPSGPSIEVYTDEINPLPASGSATSKAHTLTGFPSTMSGSLVCVTTNQGYVPYDVLDIGAVKQNSGGGSADFSEAYQYNFDATNVTLTAVAPNNGPLLAHKTNGTVSTFTPGSWKFRYTAVRYY